MNNRINFLTFIIVFASLLIGCGDDEIADSFTLEQQQELDSIDIAAFINQRGFDHALLDTTQSGVIYAVLEEGSGSNIEYNDQVSLYLTMKEANDTALIWTNIDTVLQKHDLYDSTEVYRPVVITHTQSGWALAESNFLGLKGFVGLREGMSAVLSKMNVGGKGIFITPSVYSIQSGLAASIGTYDEPFVFEVYPTFVRQ